MALRVVTATLSFNMLTLTFATATLTVATAKLSVNMVNSRLHCNAKC